VFGAGLAAAVGDLVQQLDLAALDRAVGNQRDPLLPGEHHERRILHREQLALDRAAPRLQLHGRATGHARQLHVLHSRADRAAGEAEPEQQDDSLTVHHHLTGMRVS
jgi:hypothetical protein